MDFENLRNISIASAAQRLGVKMYFGNKFRCANTSGHRNGDKSPSVSYFPATNTWKCWVCQECRGDVIDFVRIYGNMGFREAGEWLAEMVGLPGAQVKLHRAPKDQVPDKDAGQVLTALVRMGEGIEAAGRTYLESRGIAVDVAEWSGVTCLPSNARTTVQRLLERVPDSHPGLGSVLNDKGNLRFWMHRLVFPYFDQAGQVVYLQGRDPHQKAEIKEIASHSVPALPWGIRDIDEQDEVVWIAEGVIDALTLRTHGIAAVAIPGARTWRPEWAEFFRGKIVVVALDADKAGKAGTEDILSSLEGVAREVVVAELPEGKDINQLQTEGLLGAWLG